MNKTTQAFKAALKNPGSTVAELLPSVPLCTSTTALAGTLLNLYKREYLDRVESPECWRYTVKEGVETPVERAPAGSKGKKKPAKSQRRAAKSARKAAAPRPTAPEPQALPDVQIDEPDTATHFVGTMADGRIRVQELENGGYIDLTPQYAAQVARLHLMMAGR